MDTRLPRRADRVSHVAIELREERWAAEFRPRMAILSGVWEPGLWRHPRIWRIEAAIWFRMPNWRIERGQVVVDGSWRMAPHVEYVEHWVYAGERSEAIGCLVRDLNRDERAEFVSHVAVYRILPPMPRQRVLEIEQINASLRLRREEEFRRVFGGADRRPTPVEQLTFAGMR